MSTRPSPTPPAAARPKDSASTTASSHATPSLQPQPLPGMPSSSKPARGSTPGAGRPSSKAPESDRPTRPSSKDSLKQKMAKKPEDVKPSKSAEQLKDLKSDFDSLRSHLTCKICDRLLYEPYTIACGHTYCYSCLCTWFVANRVRKTCPDCRTEVARPPAPAYVIRDMTVIFINRTELLPPGETAEQHRKWQKEEADIVQQDKNNDDAGSGGLFKGCFNFTRETHHLMRAIRDQEDGVDRCPMCNWELEDGECGQCGLYFDENGDAAWPDGFSGFSDMDETSEHDMSGEDLDAEMDLEDADINFDGYDEPMDGWQDYLDGDDSFMMRRFLQHGIPPELGRRRPMSHSEFGSRRSYSQSIVSDMYTEEMDTVEEEDEEGLEEDSSMNDFIDDDGQTGSSTSASASSTPGGTPQPSNGRARYQARARRIVESEASSSISSVPEEEEDEEDEGPVVPGRRNRLHSRVLNRANGSRGNPAPPSSASTDTSGEQELDEDTQALLQADGWLLQHVGADEDMEEDNDSDGGRTTVGWDATAISNDRVRMGGSLTPTADRPRPDATIRPPSRTGNFRFMDGSRGLRRRSSVLSTSTAHYEDGEADDDDSDLEQDGDITMAMNALRSRRSRIHMRNPVNPTNSANQSAAQGLSQGDVADPDTDENSDTSRQPGGRRNTPRTRTQEYNPRISWMFADHQRTLQEFQRTNAFNDQEPRSTTPLAAGIARPRTANRNRPSPASPYSPFVPPARVPSRLRTPVMDATSNNETVTRGIVSPGGRSNPPSNVTTISADNTRLDRATSVDPASNAPQAFINGLSQSQAAAVIDMIDRPPSRVSARPPSAAGRRGSAAFSPVYTGFTHTNVGLGMGGRTFQPQRLGNPWSAFVQPNPNAVRPRNSRQALRDQSSTATLRAAASRSNIRTGEAPQQVMRAQASRIDLRAQPSRRRLNTQASAQRLRTGEFSRPPQSPSASANANAGAATSPVARSNRLAPDEREGRVRELINTRMRELAATQPGPAPVRTNPFTAGFRRSSITAENSGVLPATNAPMHSRSNSNESTGSMNSSVTAGTVPSSPGLGRRRSNRNMAVAPPPGAFAPFSPPPNTYANGYLRARQGSLTGSNPPYESSINVNTRGLSPMVAAGSNGSLI